MFCQNKIQNFHVMRPTKFIEVQNGVKITKKKKIAQFCQNRLVSLSTDFWRVTAFPPVVSPIFFYRLTLSPNFFFSFLSPAPARFTGEWTAGGRDRDQFLSSLIY
jgi:hypothetical protein